MMRTRHVNTLAALTAVVRSERMARSWTQEDLAQRIGVSRRWVGRFETGKSTAEIGLVLRVLNVLEIDLEATLPDRAPEPDAH